MLSVELVTYPAFLTKLPEPSLINAEIADQMIMPMPTYPMMAVMLLPKIDDETRVSPPSMTMTLMVSQSGPILERRYWHTVSSHAHCRLFRRLASPRRI